nr:hypothetical protein [uncultured Bacillus sp.]
MSNKYIDHTRNPSEGGISMPKKAKYLPYEKKPMMTAHGINLIK